jgi:uncharacterized membrane protein HdeD (DUF308 family)
MLPILATHWSLVLFRGSIAVIFGIPTAGVLSVGLGLLMVLRADTGAVALAWLIALDGIVVGCPLIALAMRLRQVAHEIANARPE